MRLRRGLRAAVPGCRRRRARRAAQRHARARDRVGARGGRADAAGNRRRCAGRSRRSAILRRLDELMPPSGVVLNALARIDPLPAIAGGAAPVARPPAAFAKLPAVARVRGSVVRVLGTACGLGIEGSGWVIGRDRGRDQRPRRRRRERYHGRGRWPVPRAYPRPRFCSTRATTSRSCACRASTCPRCRSRAIPRAEHPGGDSRLSARRAVRGRAGADRGHRRTSRPRTPTAADRCRAC